MILFGGKSAEHEVSIRSARNVLAALEQVLRPKVIVLRNDTGARELEGLATGVETILGQAPEAARRARSWCVGPGDEVCGILGSWQDMRFG